MVYSNLVNGMNASLLPDAPVGKRQVQNGETVHFGNVRQVDLGAEENRLFWSQRAK